MKFEVGKFYKTRDGSKVRIYAVDGKQNYPIHGAINSDDCWNSYEWDREGRFVEGSTGHVYDLIEEWEEPRAKLKAWLAKISSFQNSYPIFTIDESPPKNGWEGDTYTRAPWLDEP